MATGIPGAKVTSVYIMIHFFKPLTTTDSYYFYNIWDCKKNITSKIKITTLHSAVSCSRGS